MIKEWHNSWNEIIRKVLFKDLILKDLMMIPEGTSILEFIDRFFIKASYTSKVLKDENVRIVYSDMKPVETASHKVTRNEMIFDIYVKTEHLHDASEDLLQSRAVLIADRLCELLTSERYLFGYRFWINGDHDLGTRTVGYERYNLSVGYMKTQ